MTPLAWTALAVAILSWLILTTGLILLIVPKIARTTANYVVLGIGAVLFLLSLILFALAFYLADRADDAAAAAADTTHPGAVF